MGQYMTDELKKVEIHDYQAFGQLITEYATGAKPWPETLEGLKQATKDIATIPDTYKALQVIQACEEVLLLRLPPRRMTEESLAKYGDDSAKAYPLPDFYARKDEMSERDFYLSRVADYTIAVCT